MFLSLKNERLNFLSKGKIRGCVFSRRGVDTRGLRGPAWRDGLFQKIKSNQAYHNLWVVQMIKTNQVQLCGKSVFVGR
jgi:hypothetical protein